ncbi:hypothetical protein LY78DRAFT_655768 [Colletotrichum sublineola]|uniref:Mating-type switching protein swi10 n=1 Tax=Colletotrichum sublineola TaxID=1173701 RepID=A0A066XCH0_COLSU|nr:hypothetical protein LY78DRAFT_655768 [Colletotrichum sublineola]KDN66627.1 hypothetical protein CSUB01_07882 [Colletotrichum sublineola]
MDPSNGHSLVSPAARPDKPPESSHRLRRKLQKTFPKQRFLSIRHPAPIDPSVSNKPNTGVAVTAQQAGTVGQPLLRLSPDLSDAKWHQYLGESNAVQDTTSTPRTPDKPRKVSFDTSGLLLVPEFSHLAVTSAARRPSLDSSLSSPTSSISTRSSMRRRAKTPIYAIGQLESPKFGRDSTVADKVSSVDLIADQYTALLETQDGSSVHTDARSDPLPSRQSSHRRSSLAQSHYSASETPAELRPDVYRPAPMRNAPAPPPKPDDGTLVAFDEEAIYFKPMSFSPEFPPTPSLVSSPPPPPPPPRNQARLQRSSLSQASSNHNLSLQIATDLLSRELSATMLDLSKQKGTDMSSLQVWVMIEAYERLRDRVMETEHQSGDAKNMEAMFDTWLRALYSMHDKMTSDAASRGSHYDEADLGTED